MALILGELQVDIDGNPKGLQDAERVVAQSSKRINTNLESVDRQAKNTNKALGGIGRSAGQAGIQIQQFVGQIQGGQSVMLALSQQSADLGFVLGAPLLGAIAGISATIASFLLPSLFDSKDATKELEEALEDLSDVAETTSVTGVDVLTEKLIKLAKVSEQAAKVEIAKGIVDSGKAIEAAGSLIEESFSDAFETILGLNIEDTATLIDKVSKSGENLSDVFSDFSRVNRQFPALRNEIEKLRDEFGITNEEAIKLAQSMSDQITQGDIKSARNLGDVVGSLALKYRESNNELVEFASGILNQVRVIEDASGKTEFLEKALTNLSSAINESEDANRKNTDQVAKYIESLKIQAESLGLSGDALAEYEAKVIGATGADRDQIIALKSKIDAFNEAAKAEKGVSRVETLGLSPVGLIQARFEAELEAIQAGRELQLRTNAEFDQLELEAEQRKADALKAIQDEKAKAALKQQQAELSNLDSFLSSTSQLLAAAGKEGSAIAKAAFLAQKAIQIAQIFTATQLASIEAGSAVASGGPFAFAGTVGFVQATGAAAAAAVAAQTVGAFENGGIVPGTSFSGDNLLANVNSGEMIINHSQQRKLFEMANGQGGGGGPMSVNVINNGAPLEVQSSSMSNGELTLMVDNKIAASENRINRSLSSGRGATAQSLQKGFNAERRL